VTAKGRWAMVLVLVVLLAALTACSAQSHEPLVSPSPGDRTHEIGAAIDAYVAERQYGATRAILVSHRGRLVAERYYDSHVDDRAEVRSVTKSVMATLVGAALREGRIPNIDATLGELLPQYRSIMNARTERITVRQLLTQTAGYTDKQVNDTVPDRPTVPQLLKPGPQNPPGAGFEYQDGGPHLLSAVIAKVTGQTALDYARRVLFEPLDIQTRPAYQGSLFDVNKPEIEKIKTFGWLRDHEGIHCGSFGLKLTVRDMVKLGELYRQGGIYNGRRILDESFVRDATQAQSGDLPGFDYGYLWWVTPIGTTPAYSAIGLYGQLVVVVPSRELVVAISNGAFPPSPSPEGQLLMVETEILPRLP
jgi:CubicO group peptidase (beta-lactamase class C family)